MISWDWCSTGLDEWRDWLEGFVPFLRWRVRDVIWQVEEFGVSLGGAGGGFDRLGYGTEVDLIGSPGGVGDGGEVAGFGQGMEE